MHRLTLLAIALTLLVVTVPIAVVFADVSVGVKKGDWIEYQVTVTGNPPADHNIKSASMNVTNVQDAAINLDVLTEFMNGTIYPEHITLNLATGVLGDAFFIPKNLNVGDQFYDSYQGNITITSIEQRTVAGAERTVVLGATNYTSYVWDRATGTLVAATSNETEPPQYYMVTNTNATNIWQPDILGFAPATFYAVLIVTIVVAAAVAVISAIWIRQRKTRPILLALEAVGAVFVAIFLAAYLGGMLMTPSTTVLHSEPAFKIPLIIFGAALLILILANAAMALREKTPLNRSSALKIGLLIVAASYFLFNLHALFTLQWIGEWNFVGGTFSTAIFIEDVVGLVGIIFRFIAGFIAIGAAVIYYRKGLPSEQKMHKILKLIVVFEASYWLSILPVAAFNLYFVFAFSVGNLLSNLAWTTIPSIVESLVPSIALLMLAIKLNPNKPLKQPLKWAIISAVTYIIVFWLTNTGSWMQTIAVKGTQYLTKYPQNMLSFIVTAFGLLALVLYATYFAKRNIGVYSLDELNLRGAGVIITLLGMYFLWNYLTWIFFGGNYLWSDWYAWFLGHNLDLWMLSLPLVGLPLLFLNKPNKK